MHATIMSQTWVSYAYINYNALSIMNQAWVSYAYISYNALIIMNKAWVSHAYNNYNVLIIMNKAWVSHAYINYNTLILIHTYKVRILSEHTVDNLVACGKSVDVVSVSEHVSIIRFKIKILSFPVFPLTFLLLHHITGILSLMWSLNKLLTIIFLWCYPLWMHAH